MSNKKVMPKEKIAKGSSNKQLARAGVTPPGKAPGPSAPQRAAPMKTVVKKNVRGC